MKPFIHSNIIIVWLLIMATIPMLAQADKADEINTIKLDSTYLYAEATMLNEAEALSGAQAILEMTVTDWISSQGRSGEADAYIVQAQQHFTSIKTMRGQYHRVFLYVRKSDIIPVGPGKTAMIIERPTITLTPEEKKLAAITKFSEVEGHITTLENAGRLTGYGKKKTMPVEGTCHLLVYNREGNIVAVLRREANQMLLNLKTLAEDSFKNYPDCGAIWLQFKN